MKINLLLCILYIPASELLCFPGMKLITEMKCKMFSAGGMFSDHWSSLESVCSSIVLILSRSYLTHQWDQVNLLIFVDLKFFVQILVIWYVCIKNIIDNHLCSKIGYTLSLLIIFGWRVGILP